MTANVLKPAVVVAVYFVGFVKRYADDDEHEDTIILGIEVGDRTHLVRDRVPVALGSPSHRLWMAGTGFTTHASDVMILELPGKKLLADLVPSETLSALRQTAFSPWLPPRFSPPPLPKFSSTSAFGLGYVEDRNWRGDEVSSVPPAPTPRGPLVRWSIHDLSRPVLPADLPAVVRALVLKSSEWASLTTATKPKHVVKGSKG